MQTSISSWLDHDEQGKDDASMYSANSTDSWDDSKEPCRIMKRNMIEKKFTTKVNFKIRAKRDHEATTILVRDSFVALLQQCDQLGLSKSPSFSLVGSVPLTTELLTDCSSSTLMKSIPFQTSKQNDIESALVTLQLTTSVPFGSVKRRLIPFLKTHRIWMMKNTTKSVHEDLEDVAVVFGAEPRRTDFRHIVERLNDALYKIYLQETDIMRTKFGDYGGFDATVVSKRHFFIKGKKVVPLNLLTVQAPLSQFDAISKLYPLISDKVFDRYRDDISTGGVSSVLMKLISKNSSKKFSDIFFPFVNRHADVFLPEHKFFFVKNLRSNDVTTDFLKKFFESSPYLSSIDKYTSHETEIPAETPLKWVVTVTTPINGPKISMDKILEDVFKSTERFLANHFSTHDDEIEIPVVELPFTDLSPELSNIVAISKALPPTNKWTTPLKFLRSKNRKNSTNKRSQPTKNPFATTTNNNFEIGSPSNTWPALGQQNDSKNSTDGAVASNVSEHASKGGYGTFTPTDDQHSLLEKRLAELESRFDSLSYDNDQALKKMQHTLHKMENIFTKQLETIMKTLESFATNYSTQCSQLIQAQQQLVATHPVASPRTQSPSTLHQDNSDSDSEPSSRSIVDRQLTTQHSTSSNDDRSFASMETEDSSPQPKYLTQDPNASKSNVTSPFRKRNSPQRDPPSTDPSSPFFSATTMKESDSRTFGAARRPDKLPRLSQSPTQSHE